MSYYNPKVKKADGSLVDLPINAAALDGKEAEYFAPAEALQQVSRIVTSKEFNELTDEEKNNGTLYIITDDEIPNAEEGEF